MYFYLIGIDYNRADISLREEIYAKRTEWVSFYKENFQECALLSTCNRFEIYGSDSKPKVFPVPAKWNLISGKTGVLRHALRLAVGLESQIKGEFQILQQLNSWRAILPENLAGLWDEVYLEAQDIRKLSGLNQEEFNIATLIFEDLSKDRNGRRQLKIVVIGTGKIAELLARHRPANVQLTFAAHRNISRARQLAEYAAGKAISLSNFAQAAYEADSIISATSSPHFIIRKDDITQIILKRDGPLYIYDLAIPRDIEPALASLKGIILKNLDDLSIVFKGHNESLGQKLNLAEYLIEERLREYGKNFEDRKPAECLGLGTGR